MNKKYLLPLAILPATLIAVSLGQMLRNDQFAAYAQYAGLLPLVTITCTIASLVLYAFAFICLSIEKKKALLSCQDLYAAFSRAKKRLPLLVLLSFICMLFALLSMGLYEFFCWQAAERPPKRKDLAIMLLMISVIIWILLFYRARRTYQALSVVHPLVLRAIRIDKDEAPKLFALIEEVAREGDFLPPDTVLAGFDEGFFVLEHSAQLANGEHIPFGRILHLYIPLMVYFGEGELRAVIAHELAHLTHKDTEYNRKFIEEFRRTHIALSSMSDLDGAENTLLIGFMTFPFIGLAHDFLYAFDRIDSHWSRVREFAADKAGAAVCSKEESCLALLRTAAFTPAIDAVLASYYSRNPLPEESVFSKLTQLDTEKAEKDLKTLLEWEQPHPTDTHPTLMERMRHLGVSSDDPALIARVLEVAPGKLLHDLGIY